MIGGVAGIVAALFAILATRWLDRRRARHETTRPAVIELSRILDKAARNLPQDTIPGDPQVNSDTVDEYVAALDAADVDLQVKEVRRLAWGVRAVMWQDVGDAAAAADMRQQGGDTSEYENRSSEAARYIRKARDGMYKWLRDERRGSLIVKLPKGVTVSTRPWEAPGPSD